MNDPIAETHKAMIAARVEHDPEARAELREEVRITAILLVAQELEFMATALATAAEKISKVTAKVDLVIRDHHNGDEDDLREDPDE